MKNFSIGIDFSKETFDVTILNREFQNLGYKKFSNDPHGYRDFLKWVRCELKKVNSKNSEEWIFCGEHTGTCSIGLSDFLAAKGMDMWLQSALAIKKSMGLVRGKNDREDSKRIAEYALSKYNPSVRFHEPDSQELKNLRSLFIARKGLVQKKVAIINQLKSGTLDACKEAVKIYKKLMTTLKDEIDKLTAIITETLKGTEEFKRHFEVLDSIKGMGTVTITSLIVATHNFRYMRDPKELSCYAGVVPFKEESGTSIHGQAKVSKLRSRVLNADLTSCITSALRYNPIFINYHNTLSARGKSENIIKNNCKNKMIHIVCALIRRNEKFSADIYGKSRLHTAT